jgi:hypothetical protein
MLEYHNFNQNLHGDIQSSIIIIHVWKVRFLLQKGSEMGIWANSRFTDPNSQEVVDELK